MPQVLVQRARLRRASEPRERVLECSQPRVRHTFRENDLKEGVAPGEAFEDGRVGLTWRRRLCEAEVSGDGHEHAVADSFRLFCVARLE